MLQDECVITAGFAVAAVVARDFERPRNRW